MMLSTTTSGVDDAIVTIEFSNPPVNALSSQVREALTRAFGLLAEPRSAARAVVLRGADHRFSAGGDITELAEPSSPTRDRSVHSSFAALYHSVRDCPVPVIAAIEGYAMGGGFELALCCDLRYVTPTAKLAASAVNMGLVESAHTLASRIPQSYAAELLFTGRSVDGVEAARVGLVTRCVAAADLDSTVMEVADQIASRAPGSTRAAKAVLEMALVDQLTAAGLAEESWLRLRASADHREALAAFQIKRPPVFRGV
jgi:enoyl-CoA hydratase/carnithine racemase